MPAQGAQILLHEVREIFGRPQFHHSGNALQGMEMPEQLLEDLLVELRATGRQFEPQEQTPHRHQVLIALRVVVVEELREQRLVERHPVVRHVRRLAAWPR